MRRLLPMFVLAALAVEARAADLLDRIAVTLDSQAITETEIEREARLTAFLEGEAPGLNPVVKRKTAERLIEQRLIRRELELTNMPLAEADKRADLIEPLRRERGWTPEQLRAELERYGLTETDLIDHMRWLRTLLQFIDVRFRPGIQVSEDDAREEYTRIRNNGSASRDDGSLKNAPFEQVRSQIEEALTAARVDEEVNAWLRDAKARAQVEYREEVFQ